MSEVKTESKAKKYFFNKNVTAAIATKEHGLIKTSYKKGDECPKELEKEMIEAKHLSTEKLEAPIDGAIIDQSKKSKLPDMAARG